MHFLGLYGRSLPEHPSTTIFRASVVNAVKESEALMTQLVCVKRSELADADSKAGGIQSHHGIVDALLALDQQKSTLVKCYPVAPL